MTPWARFLLRQARHFFWLILPVLILAAPTWAQKKEEEASGPQESFVLSYALLILCAALGLFPVCRPSRRDKRAKAPK